MGRAEAVSVPVLHADFPFDGEVVEAPVAEHLRYPERVLQFGTGAFLRGFAEYFLDQANRAGHFAGRVVVVGSTGSGRAGALGEQEGLFTLCTRGLQNGEPVDACRVVASISRALSAAQDWSDVLAFAASPDLELVISNTTEVGISLDTSDRLDLAPPRSFPGKLTAVLAHRAQAFDHDPGRGLVILPCELIDDNGARLREVVLELARRWELPEPTIEWIAGANTFCNTLVDCIVTGFPDQGTYAQLVERLGYQDPMLTIAEPYRLWAIEGDEALARRIEFLAAQPGVVVTDDITAFRERKVRLLNGAHTLLVPVSLLCGNETVLDTMADEDTGAYVRQVMLREIAPSLPVDQGSARSFALEVLDRYANPYIRHELTSIAFQQTSKFGVRVLPSLQRYKARFGEIAPLISFGLAALIGLKRHWLSCDGYGLPQDDADARWRAILAEYADSDAIAEAVLSDETLWESPPRELPGITAAVAGHLKRIEQAGPREALRELLAHSSRSEHG
jgi:tagaturonate reductase